MFESPVVKPARDWYPIPTFCSPELYGADVVPPKPEDLPTNVLAEPVAYLPA